VTLIATAVVNCFLLDTGTHRIMIDTGVANQRRTVVEALNAAGCPPADLDLIVLTHCDADHVGNVAALRAESGAPVAIHTDDAGMVEHGDMTWNRKPRADRGALVFRLFQWLGPEPEMPQFTPDIILQTGDDLRAHGLDAEIVPLPGHSRGSIGILTPDGHLFCGDLLMNLLRPGLHMLIDDMAAAQDSLARLLALPAETVYPGHGKPFPMARLRKRYHHSACI
jgi:glyoxylase-like metal-dependent hydrolase (beta-lactamase superfamily II)